jgi:hypothetical protein
LNKADWRKPNKVTKRFIRTAEEAVSSKNAATTTKTWNYKIKNSRDFHGLLLHHLF